MLEKFKGYVLKHKKGVIIACVVLTGILGVSVFLKQAGDKMQEQLKAMNTPETALIEKRTLVNSISATGKVTSIDNKTVTSSAAGMDILDVYVEVGDMVSAGDVICVLDGTDIKEDLADVTTSLNSTLAKTEIDISNAVRSLQEAQASRNIDLERADKDVADAWNDYVASIEKLEDADSAYKSAKENTSKAKEAYDAGNTNLKTSEEKLTSLTEKKNAHTKAEEDFTKTTDEFKLYIEELVSSDQAVLIPDSLALLVITNDNLSNLTPESFIILSLESPEFDTEIANIQNKINDFLDILKKLQTKYKETAIDEDTYEALQEEVQLLKENLIVLELKYNTAKSNENTPRAAYDQAVTTANNKYSVYTQKVRSKDDMVRNSDSTITTRTNSLETVKLNAAVSGQVDKQKIEQYKEQLEDCTVTAPISGVITSVNVSKGDNYSGTGIVTIEDVSSFEVASEIDEYDIGKIKEGQKVVIKTNGTGDTELQGTVTFVAPRATTGSSEVTYRVEVSIDTPNEYLKMDMTAKLSIILDSKDNVLTVPYDAVQTDEFGAFYIEVVQENVSNTEEAAPQTEKIFVSKGIESDYYIEVIGDNIKEGMTVIVPAADNGLSIMTPMGPMGGF